MRTGWAVVIVIIGLGIVLFVRGVIRGAVRHARELVRRDLFALAPPRSYADAMARAMEGPVAVLAPPLLEGRESVFGWLWWRATVTADGEVEYERGWAWTYRRARRAAGLSLGLKHAGLEVVAAPVARSGAAPESGGS
ncbi:hypothetical protein [Streptomyces sp. WMMC1477]|uniref:hypothetical protein n=1 Tax=Streptomyces sp. WMMC1477 TaxID=3015155 RepID=UPI0022B635CA|nr:hypothetical protein [Streptomyces sp. WMMC1477]MCZ7430091.1 hypothetical protein [Streptomyces sp. WMMC1477]